jgi:hypothetical protein
MDKIFLIVSFSLSLCYVALGEVQDSKPSEHQTSGVAWDTKFFKRSLEKYQRVVPVRFEAKNTTSNELRINKVQGDCSACANPGASKSVVLPGETFTINAMVKLGALDGKQVGKIVVLTQQYQKQDDKLFEEVVYNLSYEITFSPPFSAVPSHLKWSSDDKSPKDLKLTFDKEGGYNYKGAYMSSTSYTISESPSGENSVVLSISPISLPAPEAQLEITYSIAGADNVSRTLVVTLGPE